MGVRSIVTAATRSRLLDQISIGGLDACWNWLGRTNAKGYGGISIEGRERRVQRVVYEWWRGEIPAGHHVHHLCKNRRCLNPRHLRLETASAHVAADGFSAQRGNQRRWREATHCKAGHPYDPTTDKKTHTGGRRCGICERATRDRYNEARRMRRAAARFA